MNLNLKEKQSVNVELSPLQYGLAGAISGFITRSILQPLDVLKIRFQLQVESTAKNSGGLYRGIFQATKTIYKQEGATSLWKGHVSAQALTVTYGLAQFFSFEFFRKQARDLGYDGNGVVITVCGGLGGMAGTLFSMPFDVARTRIIAQGNSEYSGMLDVWKKMVSNETIFSLWKGLTPTLVMTVPLAAIQFRIYYMLSDLFSSKRFEELNIRGLGITQPAFCGAVAGVTAKSIVYPLDVLKKRIQIKGSEGVRQRFGKVVRYRSVWHCIESVTVEEGPLAWFKGLKVGLLKAAFSSAFIFTFYELTSLAIATLKNEHSNRPT